MADKALHGLDSASLSHLLSPFCISGQFSSSHICVFYVVFLQPWIWLPPLHPENSMVLCIILTLLTNTAKPWERTVRGRTSSHSLAWLLPRRLSRPHFSKVEVCVPSTYSLLLPVAHLGNICFVLHGGLLFWCRYIWLTKDRILKCYNEYTHRSLSSNLALSINLPS